MAITRTPQIDDDGSGTTGTIWNNAWKTELYNQIDANPATIVYTPVWGSTGTPPALGPSTLTGAYVRQGSLTHVWINFVIQSGAQVGTGAWTFSLPVGVLPNFALTGTALLTIGGGQTAGAVGIYNSAFLVVFAPGAPNGITGTLPGAWTVGDGVILTASFVN